MKKFIHHAKLLPVDWRQEMVIIRSLLTIAYIWMLPFLLGMGALLLFEEKLNYAKAWFWGFLIHIGLFSCLIRFVIMRGWSNRKIALVWMGASFVGVVVSAAIYLWKRRRGKELLSIQACDLKKIFVVVLGVMIVTVVLHMLLEGADNNILIVTATNIYKNGSPAALDYNAYTGDYTGVLTNGSYNKQEAFLGSYYAIIATLAGLAPATMIRFIVSAPLLMESLLVVGLIASYIWPGDKKALRLMFASFGIIELAILFSNRGEMLQLLSTTWSGSVLGCYIWVPSLFYVFMILQDKVYALWNKEKAKKDTLERVYRYLLVGLEIVVWTVILLFCGNLWRDYAKVCMEIWCGLFVVCVWLRRYVIHD